MRPEHAALLGFTLVVASCGGERGPGVYAAYFVHFERVQTPGPAEHPDWQAPADVVMVLPDGRWIVDTVSDGRWLFDPGSQQPVHPFPGGQLWITGAGVVSAEVLSAGELRRYDDLASPIAIPAPEALVAVTHFAVDPQRERVFYAGVQSSPVGPQGAAYQSDDWGATWAPIANLLQPLQGEAASVVFLGVAGFQRLGVCPPSGVFESGSPVCEDYRTFEGATSRGYVYNLPTPIGWDADGRVLARCSPEDHGRPHLGIVALDPSDHEVTCDALPPVLGSFLPEGGEVSLDLEGHLGTTGWNLVDHGAFRSTAPAGRGHDQRDVILGGWGCEDYFRADLEGGPAGDDMDFSVTNGTDEPLSLHHVANYRLQGANPQLAPEPIAPGATQTGRRAENHWMMAVTDDGRCAGFGQVRKLDGRSLR